MRTTMSDIERCPKCGDDMQQPRVAVSRRDNKTIICPECGVAEALLDLMKQMKREIDSIKGMAEED